MQLPFWPFACKEMTFFVCTAFLQGSGAFLQGKGFFVQGKGFVWCTIEGLSLGCMAPSHGFYWVISVEFENSMRNYQSLVCFLSCGLRDLTITLKSLHLFYAHKCVNKSSSKKQS